MPKVNLLIEVECEEKECGDCSNVGENYTCDVFDGVILPLLKRGRLERLPRCLRAQKIAEAMGKVAEIAKEISFAAVSFEDPRIKYKEIQIHAVDWDALKDALAALKEAKEGK